jgi:hypothetical protein
MLLLPLGNSIEEENMSRNPSNPQLNVRLVTRKEFSNVAGGLAHGALTGPLQGKAKQIADFIVSNVDSPDYHDLCSLSHLEIHFETTAATLRSCLRAPTQLGLLVIQGRYVYPTALLLCMSTPKLNNSEAARIVHRLKTASMIRS